MTTKFKPSRNTALGLGGAALLALGLAGGAGAVSLTRPAVEMAPANPVAISSLASRDGIVTVKGRIAETYGDRFTVVDASGKTLVDLGVDAGRDRTTALTAGAPVTVQGRFDDGQLKASFLVAPDGTIDQVGPRGPRHHGPDGRGPGGPGHDGPPPPPGGPRADGAGAPPPPPAGCAPGAAPAKAPGAPAAGAPVAPPPPAA